MVRTTVFLPDEVHEQLRREASRVRITIAELILQRLRSPAVRAANLREVGDPLLRVAGICRGEVISENID